MAAVKPTTVHTAMECNSHFTPQTNSLTKFSDALPLFSLFTINMRPDTFSTKVSICERFPTNLAFKLRNRERETDKNDDSQYKLFDW